MRVLVIGAEGTVGRAAVAALGNRHRIITLLDESAARLAILLPGHESISSTRAGLAYVKSVEGGQTGQVYCIG